MSTALRTYWRGATLAAMQDHVAGVTRTYHLDHQGTVQCLTDDNGVVTDRFSCDAWGNQFTRTGTSINRHWYIGHLGYYRQVDQALDYVRARYLWVQGSRWLTQDPILVSSGASRYRYVSNRPSDEVDATGLFPTTKCNSEGLRRLNMPRLLKLLNLPDSRENRQKAGRIFEGAVVSCMRFVPIPDWVTFSCPKLGRGKCCKPDGTNVLTKWETGRTALPKPFILHPGIFLEVKAHSGSVSLTQQGPEQRDQIQCEIHALHDILMKHPRIKERPDINAALTLVGLGSTDFDVAGITAEGTRMRVDTYFYEACELSSPNGKDNLMLVSHTPPPPDHHIRVQGPIYCRLQVPGE